MLFVIAVVVWVNVVLGRSPYLETYNVDHVQVSVSGISSGACMATQLHVIHSSRIMGAGVVAGVPFACSGGTIAGANTCMTSPSSELVGVMEGLVSSGAFVGTVDSPSHLRNDRVYIFHGTNDSVVRPGNGPNIERFYKHFISNSNNIKTVFNMNAEHSMPTENYGGSCNKLSTSDYLNNCGYSAAYDILNFLYGGHFQKPAHETIASGRLMLFDQSEFFHLAPPITYGMDDSGYIYVPSGCLQKHHKCKLHVALHGCKMGRQFIGDTYVRHAGYNDVAEINDVIMLYPQAVKTALNPNGCWDWWGYTGMFFATNNGFQIVGLQRMMERVIGVW